MSFVNNEIELFQRLHRLLVNQSFSFHISIYNQLKLIKVVRNLHLPSFLRATSYIRLKYI
ncbi:hypothetical protein HanIR_Chr16g0800671 [Helianthus annuus]|nr:hypothetical protein HanIR_Chr16g0800671 [Helianthus annuus]